MEHNDFKLALFAIANVTIIAALAITVMALLNQ